MCGLTSVGSGGRGIPGLGTAKCLAAAGIAKDEREEEAKRRSESEARSRRPRCGKTQTRSLPHAPCERQFNLRPASPGPFDSRPGKQARIYPAKYMVDRSTVFVTV